MSILAVLAAGLAAWLFGAVWYSIMAKPWMEASGVEVTAEGRPINQKNPAPYVVSIVAAILVAGMMRHIFNLAGIDSVDKGLVAGLGIGLFLATPWLATCYGFAGRPVKLTLIDGIYATAGSMVIGVVLTLF